MEIINWNDKEYYVFTIKQDKIQILKTFIDKHPALFLWFKNEENEIL